MNKKTSAKISLAFLLSLLMAANTSVIASAVNDASSGAVGLADNGLAVVGEKLTPTSTASNFAGAEVLFDGDPLSGADMRSDMYADFIVDTPVQLTEVRVSPKNMAGLFSAAVYDATRGFAPWEGAQYLFDYNDETKWCHVIDEQNGSYVIWSMDEAVAVNGYQMVTANDTEGEPGRNPTDWTLYGSNDYSSVVNDTGWAVIDEVTDCGTLEALNYTSYDFMLEETAPEYQYFKLAITGIVEGDTCQLSGFNLLYDSDAPSGFVDVAAVLLGMNDDYEGESCDKLFDYNSDTKWCNKLSKGMVYWEMEEAVAINGYQMVMANDIAEYPERIPTGWWICGTNYLEPESGRPNNWWEIHEVKDDTVLQAENNAAYNFMLDDTTEAYKYYMISITDVASYNDEEENTDALFQIADFNLLYDISGRREEPAYEREVEMGESLDGLKIQGSSDGEEWITLYRFMNENAYRAPFVYTVTADMMGSAASEYTFTQFRVVDDSDEVFLADVEFYGVANFDLPQFPTQEQLKEPIYSYVNAEDIFLRDADWQHIWWVIGDEDLPYSGYENPVMIIGGALPADTTINVDTVTKDGVTHDVIGFAPFAFENESDMKAVYLDDNILYVYTRALSDSPSLETVYVGSSLRSVVPDAFSWDRNIKSFKAADDLTDARAVVENNYFAINGMLIRYATASEPVESITVNDGIRTICNFAFENAQIGSIECRSVEEVSNGAFFGCSASEIIFSPDIRWIADSAFAYCDNLTTLRLPTASIEFEGQYYNEENGMWEFYAEYFKTYDAESDSEIFDTAQKLTISTYQGNLIEDYVNLRQTESKCSNITVSYLDMRLNDLEGVTKSEGSESLFDDDSMTYAEADGGFSAELVLPTEAELTQVVITPAAKDGFSQATPISGTEGEYNESYDKLFDLNIHTKWCDAGFEGEPEVIWEIDEPAAITGYTITTAGDTAEYPGRNPNSWVLYGSTDCENWQVIHDVENDEILEDVNLTTYEFELEEAAPEYKYYKLVIREVDDGPTLQIAEFNLVYDGYRALPDEDEVNNYLNKMEGVLIQGSTNGEDWITLYRVPYNEAHSPEPYVVTYDMLGSAAHEYRFTRFRVTNTTQDFKVAEVEFYGDTSSSLEVFPTEITEPIYSYVRAWDILDIGAYNFGDGDYIWQNEGQLYIADEFSNPVMIIGGVLPDGTTTLDYSAIDNADQQVVGFAPFAFAHNSNIATVEAEDNLRYICEYAFGGCENLTTVVLNKHIREIHGIAFADCPNFAEYSAKYDDHITDEEKGIQNGRFIEVGEGYIYRDYILLDYPQALNQGGEFTVPSTFSEIEYFAFDGSSLKKVDLSESNVTHIWHKAFAYSDIEEVILSDNLEYIESEAFRGSMISSIDIPAGVTEIRNEAFRDCENLTEVTLRSMGEFNYGRTDNEYRDIFDKNAEGYSVPQIYLYGGTQAEEVAAASSWTYDYISTDSAVYDIYTADDGVHLGNAVANGYTDFVIPEDVMIIDDNAFRNVDEIDSVTFPSTLYDIADGAFAGKGEFTVTWGGAVPVSFAENVFDFTPTAQYDGDVFVDNFRVMYNEAKKEAAVFGYWFGAIDENGVLRVPRTVTIDGEEYTVTAIMDNALQDGIGFERVLEIAEDEVLDESGGYEWRDFSEVILPDTVKFIGYDAMSWRYNEAENTGLTSVTLPAGLIKIRDNFVVGNKLLETVEGLDAYGEGSENRYRLSGGAIIDTIGNDFLFFYPSGKADTAYSIPEGVKYIYNNAFYDNDNLVNVAIPASLEDVWHGVFFGCDSIVDFSVNEDNGIFTIADDGSLCMENSERLAAFPFGRIPESGEVEIHEGTRVIANGALQGSSALKRLVIPHTVEHIDDWSVSENPNLETVEIHGALDNLNLDVFAYNDSLESITYHGDNNIGLWWYVNDEFPIRTAKDVYGNNMYGENGAYKGEKTMFYVVDENCKVDLFTLTDYDWENPDNFDYETYTVENNPYLTVVYLDTAVFSVTYEAGDTLGVYFVPPTQHKIAGEPITITDQLGECMSGTFLGWTTVDGSAEIKYRPGDIYDTDADLTLYPVFNIEMLKITIDPNGGTAEQTVYEFNHSYWWTLSAFNVAREGYRFLGWATEADSNEIAYTVHDWYGGPDAEDITLYAVWQEDPTYTVNYNLNGADGELASQSAKEGTAITLSSEVPERTGYKFNGWAYSADAASADLAAGEEYSYESPVQTVDFEDEYTINLWGDAEFVEDEFGKAVKIVGDGETNGKNYAWSRTNHRQTDWSDGFGVSMWVKADIESETFNVNAPLFTIITETTGEVPGVISALGSMQTVVDIPDIGVEMKVYEEWPNRFTGEWQNVVVSYSANDDGGVYCEFYLNGKWVSGGVLPDITYAQFAEQLGNAAYIVFGSWDEYYTDYISGDFDGLIDEVKLYNKALTEADSRYLASKAPEAEYNSESNTNNITLYAVWKDSVGDVDSDGDVDTDDSDLLAKYFAGWAVEIDKTAADVNKDEKLTRADAMILARHTAGWDGYSELPYKAQ